MSNDIPGILTTYFEIAAVLTIPVSQILLMWYRRDVALGMLVREAAKGAMTSSAVTQPAAIDSNMPNLSETAARRMRKHLATIYFLGTFAASIVTTYMWFRQPDAPEFNLLRGFLVAYSYCWLLAPTIAIMLAAPLREAVLLFISYFVIGATVVFVWSLFSSFVLGRPDVSPINNVGWYSNYLFRTAGPPAAVVLLTGFRRIRPVAPVVFAGLVTFSFAALGTENVFTTLVDSYEVTRSLLLAIPHSMLAFFMLAAVPVGYVCWLVLRGVSWSFETKRFSDMQFLVDTWWLIAFFWICVDWSTKTGWWGLVGLVGFVTYRGTVALGLAVSPMGGVAETAQDLLLLRVFGFQGRTEQLFDAIAQPWRFKGRVSMIAGSDLAGRIVDPGDIVSFVGGRLRDEFVRDAGDLQRRLSELARARDPDGRYRVAKFFCHADSWQPAVKALMRHSDLVLMDLRGFTQQNSGCLFELQSLASGRKLDRTLFVVDKDTDVELLRSTLQKAWSDAGFDGETPLHSVRLERQTAYELTRVARELSSLAPAT